MRLEGFYEVSYVESDLVATVRQVESDLSLS